MSVFDDKDSYLRVPTRTPSGCLSLARALLVAAPKTAPAVVVERLTGVHAAATVLQDAWIELTRPSKGESPRFYDRRLDRAWSIFYARTQHWIEIEHPEKAERAEEIVELLFPTGLDFIGYAFADEWSESEKRLVTIKKDELEAELVELIGQVFVDYLLEAHADYGEVLGITSKKEAPAEVGVLEPIRALRTAMSDYAMLVIALTKRDDQEAVAAAEAQLEPIPRFRTPRGAAEKVEESPEEPLPPPPLSE